MDNVTYREVEESAAYLQSVLRIQPKVALILGSGLGGLSERIEDPQYVDYADVPNMVQSTVEGHMGRFVVGTLSGKPVICMQGRLHAYEGHTSADVAFPIYVMRALGVEVLLITNASGGINTSFEPGDIMLIDDHINFTGMNPLIGPHDPALGLRYNDMSYAYDPDLRSAMRRAAAELDISLREGVYIGVLGPSFETPAEIRAFRALGADAVGMSTIFEVIAAVNCGIKVVGLSLVTNMAAGVLDREITAEEVNETAAKRTLALQYLVQDFLAKCDPREFKFAKDVDTMNPLWKRVEEYGDEVGQSEEPEQPERWDLGKDFV